jgi:hypothetical protein
MMVSGFQNQTVSAFTVGSGVQHVFYHFRQRISGQCPKLFISVSDVFEKNSGMSGLHLLKLATISILC